MNISDKKTKVSEIVSRIGSFFAEWKSYFIVLIATVCYGGIMYNQTMPFAEGWYTYYAQCINKGEVVYKDFDYLFTPLYIYFISFFTKIFGYKIIALRVLGVLFFVAIATFVFLAIKEVFNDKIAIIGTIAAVFYMQSEPVQLFYDYIRMMDIFACATIFFLVKYVKNIELQKKRRIFLICAGVSNALFILVKQNVGIVFGAFSVVLIIAVNCVLHKKYKELLDVVFYALGIIAPILIACILLLASGSLGAFFNQTGAGAIAAKGGVVAILFNWFSNNAESFESSRSFAIYTLLIIAAAFLIDLYFRKET